MIITGRGIYLFHMLVVAPLLMYVGYTGVNTPQMIFNILMLLAVLVFLYHGNRVMQMMAVEESSI